MLNYQMVNPCNSTISLGELVIFIIPPGPQPAHSQTPEHLCGCRCHKSALPPRAANHARWACNLAWFADPRHQLGHGSLNVPIEHHPTIRYMVYNDYYKVMSNISKMGQLPTPVGWLHSSQAGVSNALAHNEWKLTMQQKWWSIVEFNFFQASFQENSNKNHNSN